MTDDEIVKAKYLQLNKEFYDNFDTEYFNLKVTYLFSILSDIDGFDKHQQRKMEYGKVKAEGNPLSTTEKELLVRQLKTELTLNYYHAVETFFRLLVAHSRHTHCVWQELTLLTDFRSFKKSVSLMQQEEFTFPPKFNTYNETLEYLIFGGIKPKSLTSDTWSKNLKNVKEYIYHFANDLLKYKEYNSYKHGLAIFPSKLKSLKIGGVIDAQFGEMLLYLEFKREKQEDGKEGVRLYRTHSSLLWEQRLGFTFILTNLIKNLVSVGRLRFLREGDVSIKLFDTYSLEDVLKADKSEGVSLSQFSASV